MYEFIYLEPRSHYDDCITGKCNETKRIIYSYDAIVEMLKSHIWSDGIHSEEECYQIAFDHISFNIEGMRPSFQHWPILHMEGDELEETEEEEGDGVVRNKIPPY